MSFSLEESKLSEEIAFARKTRNDRMRIQKKLKSGYHGPFHRGNSSDLQYDPENHAYRYISHMVSQIFFKSPRFNVESRIGGPGFGVAVVHKHLLNLWAQEPETYESLFQQAHDILFSHCVSLVTMRDDYRFTTDDGKPARNPYMERVSPEHMLIDPYALGRYQARFVGHEWIIDREDLVDRAARETDSGWIAKVIKELPAEHGVDKFRKRKSDGPQRDEIVCADLWIPGMDVDDDVSPDEGFNGTIVTVAIGAEDDVRIIREPMPCLAPKWGPYSLGDINYVQDEPIGLAPLVAQEGSARELNEVARSVSEMIKSYAQFLLIDDNDPAFAQKIKNAKNQAVLSVRGLDKNKIASLSKGGATPEVINHLEILRERLQRDSSLDDGQLGLAQRRTTATASVIADSASDVRTDMNRTRFSEHVQRTGAAMSYMYFYSKEARARLDAQAVLTDMGLPYEMAVMSGVMSIEYKGGDVDEYDGLSWCDMQIQVEPRSMDRANERAAEQQQAITFFKTLMSILPLSAQFPDADWPKIANALGDKFNQPDAARMLGLDRGRMSAQPAMAPEEGAMPSPGQPVSAQAGGRGMQGYMSGANT